MLSSVDFAQSFAVVGIDKTELKFRHARELLAGFLDFRRVQARDLHENAIIRHRADDRFADSKNVNTLANDLHCLVEHPFTDYLIAGLEPNEEGGAALNIEAERNLFLWWPDCGDTEHDKHQHQRQRQEALPQPLIGGEIPPEEDEHREPDKKCNRGSHSISECGL